MTHHLPSNLPPGATDIERQVAGPFAPNADDLATTFEEYHRSSIVYTVRDGAGDRVGVLAYDSPDHPYNAARLRLWEQAPAMWELLADILVGIRVHYGDGKEYEAAVSILAAIEGRQV